MEIEEARELAELTDRIVANLKTIAESGYTDSDLDDMVKQTGNIVENLQTIDASNV
jgi:hypothetical protein